MMLLYLWPMLLLVVGWITLTHFSGVSQGSIANYSASKIVQLESYQIPVDRLVYLLCLRKCIDFLLNISQSLKQPPLFTSFFTLVFPSILLHISLPTAVLTVPGTVRVVVISFWFQCSNLLSINLSSSLVIVLLLMPPTLCIALPDEIRASPSLVSFMFSKPTKACPP